MFYAILNQELLLSTNHVVWFFALNQLMQAKLNSCHHQKVLNLVMSSLLKVMNVNHLMSFQPRKVLGMTLKVDSLLTLPKLVATKTHLAKTLPSLQPMVFAKPLQSQTESYNEIKKINLIKLKNMFFYN